MRLISLSCGSGGYVLLSWRYSCLNCQFDQKKWDIKLARHAVMMTRVTEERSLLMTDCSVSASTSCRNTNTTRSNACRFMFWLLLYKQTESYLSCYRPTTNLQADLYTWQRHNPSLQINKLPTVSLSPHPRDYVLLFLQVSVEEVRKVDFGSFVFLGFVNQNLLGKSYLGLCVFTSSTFLLLGLFLYICIWDYYWESLGNKYFSMGFTTV